VLPCGIFVPKKLAARELFLAAFLCLGDGYIWIKCIFKEVIVMTLNIFFISITFKKHQESLEQATRNETIEKLYEQNKERQLSIYHLI
jgi:uncharacterized protein (TIGR02413 family)